MKALILVLALLVPTWGWAGENVTIIEDGTCNIAMSATTVQGTCQVKDGTLYAIGLTYPPDHCLAQMEAAMRAMDSLDPFGLFDEQIKAAYRGIRPDYHQLPMLEVSEAQERIREVNRKWIMAKRDCWSPK